MHVTYPVNNLIIICRSVVMAHANSHNVETDVIFFKVEIISFWEETVCS